MFISCELYTDKPITVLYSEFNLLFREAAFRAPTVFVLENLDTLIPKEKDGVDSTRSRAISELLGDLLHKYTRSFDIVAIATISKQNSLHDSFHQRHIFGKSIKLPAPSRIGREEVSYACINTGCLFFVFFFGSHFLV